MLRDVLDPDTLEGLKAWPHDAPSIRYDHGRREENNATRRYVDAEAIDTFPPARALAEALQDTRVTGAIEARCGVALAGTNLRIEYAQDGDGFWLEPHTDIGVKTFTMFVYLDDGNGDRDLGTDLFSNPRDARQTAPFRRQLGYDFHSRRKYLARFPEAPDGRCEPYIALFLCKRVRSGSPFLPVRSLI